MSCLNMLQDVKKVNHMSRTCSKMLRNIDVSKLFFKFCKASDLTRDQRGVLIGGDVIIFGGESIDFIYFRLVSQTL